MQYIDFKKTAINKIPYSEKRQDYRINGYKYLLLRVSKTSKSFTYYRKIKSRPVKKKIGNFENVGLKFIEDRYYEINTSVAKGEGINESRNISLRDLFSLYIESHKEKKSLKMDIWRFNHKLSGIDSFAISDISYDIIIKFHENLKDKPTEANRLIALLSTLFNFAINKLRIKIDNPCKGITKYKEFPKKRILKPNEIVKFYKTIEKYYNENKSFYADLFLIMLLCGQRKTNVLNMRYDAIDINTGEWQLDSHEMKNKNEHTAILNSDAIRIIKRRKIENPHAKYVFQSPVNRNEPIKEVKRAWANFLKAAEIENLTIHDLRRTFGAYLLMKEGNLKTVQEMLGHKDIGTTAKGLYAHSSGS